jgi:hypothetical protein
MSNIYDGLDYLYAENLQNKDWELTIKKIVGGVEFVEPNSKQKKKGFDIHFTETDKKLGITGSTVRRQLFMATGTEETDKMTGKKITLYPVKSARAATGQAIRIRV